MRWYTKLILLLLLLALVLPLWLRAPDGRSVMSVEDWLETPASLESIADKARDALQPLSGEDVGEDEGRREETAAGSYYSWQDAAGVWHFSDQPPEQLAEHPEPQPLPEPANRIGAPPPAPGVDGPLVDGGNSAEIDSSIGVPLPAGVSREAIETLLQEAHDRRMGDQR